MKIKTFRLEHLIKNIGRIKHSYWDVNKLFKIQDEVKAYNPV